MKMSGGPATVNLKVALIIIAAFIAGGTLYYTQTLVKKLQERERQILQFYATGLEYIVNSDSDGSDLTFLFDNIIKPIDFPIILTDADNNVDIEKKFGIRNVDFDTTLSESELRQFFHEKISEMDALHKPISVMYEDSIILTKIHYGDSEIITRLKYFPYVQIVIASLFILLGYLGFSNIKKSEQSNIWVGMAKETAHQFGTPISSLMGWVEMLKLHYANPDKVLDTTNEIETDIEKLNKITYRFSKIGSIPELKECSVVEEIHKVIEYFNRRLPQIGKKVTISLEGENSLIAKLNPELFEWVMENLIKNALDAIDHKEGSIHFNVTDARNKVEIEVTDTGKGVEVKRRKDIFRPGYSTKRRGWGLGLSLSKRIIEEYHNGKITLKNSTPGEGTTFKIILKKV